MKFQTSAPAHREQQFHEPLTATFLYAAWSIDPRRVGPFVRSSSRRRKGLDHIRAAASELIARQGVEWVRVFETSFMPPLPGVPRNDIVMLVRTQTAALATDVRNILLASATGPATTFVASNAVRFGETDCPPSGVNILLNHFTGPPDRLAAADCWRGVSRWYAAKTGIDNSTLLSTDEDAPYVLVNYARIPGAVIPFMLQMLLRPSFYREVRAVLTQHGITSLPLFVRPLLPGEDR